jgi:uncharacterized RDD family membrane protein YckC
LFHDRSQPKVIPFESLPGAARPSAPPAVRPTPQAGGAAAAPARAPSRRTPAAKSTDQPTLDFLSPSHQAPRTLKTRVQAVIYCDAPVATPAHRAVAAGLDLAMVTIGYALFLGAFYFGGGEFVLNKTTLSVYAGAFVLLLMFYHLLWVLAGGDTPGMHWTQLRTVNFDGFAAERRERFIRYLGACLSFSAAGLGVLWSLVDEESLTWQDHISKTFPTLRELDSAFVRKT